MLDLVENYNSNLETFTSLQKKLINLLEYNTRITATYDITGVCGGGGFSSKVEKHALEIIDTEQKIMELGNSITAVDKAEKVLNNKEKEVIKLIKAGNRNKLTVMAKMLNKDKKYIFDTRNRAIRKMNDYIST